MQAQGMPATIPLPPTQKGRATRERLLQAGEVVFGDKGYEPVRVADIIAQAGISHGLFYRHFADKDAILSAILVRLNDRLRHTSAREPGDGMVPTLAQMEMRNILFFREYAEHRNLLRVAREAAALSTNASFRTHWLGNRQIYVARTCRWIEGLCADGHIKAIADPASIAEGLSALTEQMAYVQLGLAEQDPDTTIIDRLGRACGLIWYRTLFGLAE